MHLLHKLLGLELQAFGVQNIDSWINTWCRITTENNLVSSNIFTFIVIRLQLKSTAKDLALV